MFPHNSPQFKGDGFSLLKTPDKYYAFDFLECDSTVDIH